MSGLWIVLENPDFDGINPDILVAKYANRDVFELQFEHNKMNAMLCLPTRSDNVDQPIFVWMKGKAVSTASEAPNVYGVRKALPMFGISVVESYDVQINGRKNMYRQSCRFAFVLMDINLQTELQHTTRIRTDFLKDKRTTKEGTQRRECLRGPLCSIVDS